MATEAEAIAACWEHYDASPPASCRDALHKLRDRYVELSNTRGMVQLRRYRSALSGRAAVIAALDKAEAPSEDDGDDLASGRPDEVPK